MSVVDLNVRLSSNRDNCEISKKSSESLIYTDADLSVLDKNPMSVDLSVGDVYILPGDSSTYKIEKDGLKVKPKQSVVLYTKEKFILPLNVFGLVTGKGKYIFQGCMVASGKIDPGYSGTLKVCFFNGGKTTVRIKTGDVFCTVFFMDGDCTLNSPLSDYQNNPNPKLATLHWWQSLWSSIIHNKFTTFMVVVNFIIGAHWIYTDFIKNNENDNSIRKSERINRTDVNDSIDCIR